MSDSRTSNTTTVVEGERHGANEVLIPSPTDVGALSNRINFHTRDMHNKADAFVAARMAIAARHGFIYRQALLSFYFIFRAVEREIDSLLAAASTSTRNGREATAEEEHIGEILSQFWCEEYRRAPMLEKDLALFYKDECFELGIGAFINSQPPPPHVQKFVQIIKADTVARPATILAYCHVLYNALFAGGRVIRSNAYRYSGLFPKIPNVSQKELVQRGTNFFTFAPTVNQENAIRRQYKKNYELSTRQALSEEQKLQVIAAARQIFQLTIEIIDEVGKINKKYLMSSPSFRLITYVVEEWRYYATKNNLLLLPHVLLTTVILLLIVACYYTLMQVGVPKLSRLSQ